MEVPFSTKNRQSRVQGRPGASKVSSGSPPDGCSGFGRFFGPALGGPMCSKYSTGYVQTTFRLGKKSAFLDTFLGAFWSLLGTLGAYVGHFRPQSRENGAPRDGPRKCSKKRVSGYFRVIPTNSGRGVGHPTEIPWQAGNRDLPQACGSVEIPGAQ